MAQFVRKRICPLGYGPGSKTNNYVAVLGKLIDQACQSLRGLQGLHGAVPMVTQALNQGITVNTFDRCFSSGMDRRHNHRIGIVETGTEFFKEIAQAGIAMGLNYGDNAVPRSGASSWSA